MLTVTWATYKALIAAASSEPTREVCGLVWRSEGREVVRPLPNIHPEPAKYYRTAPKDVREAYEEIDAAGGEPIVWYHSHPGGKPDPSEEDMRGAMTPGLHHFILYPETTDLMNQGNMVGTRTDWLISTWYCLEFGLLVQAEVKVEMSA